MTECRQWTDAERADVLRRWNDGQSSGRIGDHYNVNRDVVMGIIRRARANGVCVRDTPPADRKDPNPGRPKKPDAQKAKNVPCGACGVLIDRRGITGLCRDCMNTRGGMRLAMVKAGAMQPCVECGSPCKNTRGDGRCAKCYDADRQREKRNHWRRACPCCGEMMPAARDLCVSCNAAENHRRKVEAAANWPSGRRRECPLADLPARKVAALLPITRALSRSDDEALLMAAFAVAGAIQLDGFTK